MSLIYSLDKRFLVLLISFIFILIYLLPFANAIDSFNGFGKYVPETYITFQDSQWKYAVIEDTQAWSLQYPRYLFERHPDSIPTTYYQTLIINTPGKSKAYIEKEFKIPNREASLSIKTGNSAVIEIFLFDEKNIQHYLGDVSPAYYEKNKYNYDLSPYAGQKVRIRIIQSSGYPNGGGWNEYSNIELITKEYTLSETISTFIVQPIIYIIIFSAFIGFILGFSEYKFPISYSNKFQLWILKKYDIYSKSKKLYAKYYLKFAFFIANKSLQLADKIQNPKLHTGIKSALMVGLPIIFVYLTLIIIYIMIIIIIYIVIFAIIIFIIFSLLGGSPSGGSVGGGGSSSGSGGGSSSSSSGAIFGSSYEETAKEESRPFKVDKETSSSEGALPFGLGGDTLYKTEYEDNSTGGTVKGYGWTRSEADFNARKNLKKK